MFIASQLFLYEDRFCIKYVTMINMTVKTNKPDIVLFITGYLLFISIWYWIELDRFSFPNERSLCSCFHRLWEKIPLFLFYFRFIFLRYVSVFPFAIFLIWRFRYPDIYFFFFAISVSLFLLFFLSVFLLLKLLFDPGIILTGHFLWDLRALVLMYQCWRFHLLCLFVTLIVPPCHLLNVKPCA